MCARKILLVSFALLLVSQLSSVANGAAVAPKVALPCDVAKCKPPNCRCSSTDIPGSLLPKNTPQFVMLTFDDAVTVSNMPYYREVFTNKVNNDSCPVSATFFTTHEYTDYTLVHELYSAGHEIALHSISHNANTDYWRKASVAQLTEEFVGERKNMERFAKIPSGHIQGLRMPFLQIAGDNTFEMMKANQFTYDCSMPTRAHVNPGLWPYTLDYQSTQDCVIGPCPTKSFPGVWVVPMITWTMKDDFPCAMVDTCLGMPNKTQELFEYFKKNFEQSYLGNKAPFGVYLHAAWFDVSPVHFEAYKKFVDYLQSLQDVFMVSASTVVNWVKNPVPISEMKTSSWSKCRKPAKSNCKAVSCELCKKEGDNFSTRWAKFCDVSCPNSYPWLENHFGEQDYRQSCKNPW